MSRQKITNLAYLKEISKGSNAFIKKMLLIILKETPKALNSIEKHHQNKDWPALRAISHKLRATFMFIGVKKLPDIVNSVEEYAANESNLDLLPEMILEIKNLTNIALKELEVESKAL